MILKKVFSEKEFDIKETEEPDFILTNEKSKEKFGVEITELFINQSSARIKKIPNYISTILNGENERRYKAKEDIANLPTVKIYVKDERNNKRNIVLEKAVKIPTVSIEEYIEKVKQSIQTKNNKNYKNRCENVELVINDAEEFFYDKDILLLNKLLKNEELLRLVKNSIFRVIYIITKYNKEDVIITIGEKKNSVNLDEYEVVFEN